MVENLNNRKTSTNNNEEIHDLIKNIQDDFTKKISSMNDKIDEFSAMNDKIDKLSAMNDKLNKSAASNSKKTTENSHNQSANSTSGIFDPLKINQELQAHAKEQEIKINNLNKELDAFKRKIALSNFINSVPHTSPNLFRWAVEDIAEFDDNQNIIDPEKLTKTLTEEYPELISKQNNKNNQKELSENNRLASADASAGKNQPSAKKFTKENIKDLSMQEYFANRDAVLEVLKS